MFVGVGMVGGCQGRKKGKRELCVRRKGDMTYFMVVYRQGCMGGMLRTKQHHVSLTLLALAP